MHITAAAETRLVAKIDLNSEIEKGKFKGVFPGSYMLILLIFLPKYFVTTFLSRHRLTEIYPILFFFASNMIFLQFNSAVLSISKLPGLQFLLRLVRAFFFPIPLYYMFHSTTGQFYAFQAWKRSE